MSNVPNDIGCENPVCKEAENCKRQAIYKDATAREVKKFGGTPEKGCGKFLPKESKK